MGNVELKKKLEKRIKKSWFRFEQEKSPGEFGRVPSPESGEDEKVEPAEEEDRNKEGGK